MHLDGPAPVIHLDKCWQCGRHNFDIVHFYLEKQAECTAAKGTAVGAVAGIAEERRGEESVAHCAADTASCYCWEGFARGHDEGVDDGRLLKSSSGAA